LRAPLRYIERERKETRDARAAAAPIAPRGAYAAARALCARCYARMPPRDIELLRAMPLRAVPAMICSGTPRATLR